MVEILEDRIRRVLDSSDYMDGGIIGIQNVIRMVQQDYRAHVMRSLQDPDLVRRVASAMYSSDDKQCAYTVVERSGMDGSIIGQMHDETAARWFSGRFVKELEKELS